MIDHLLEPGYIGSLALKNRIIYAAMTHKLTDHQGHLTDSEIETLVYHTKQAYSPGLITFPGINVWFGDDPRPAVPDLRNDEMMLSLRHANRRVKVNGVKTMAQIGIAGFKLAGTGQMQFGSTSHMYSAQNPVNLMTIAEIQEFTETIGDVARRVRDAEFDAFQLAAGVDKKLITMFLSPIKNQRTDQYGGSTGNRARLLIEIAQNIHQKAGADFPVIPLLRVDALLGKYDLTLADGQEISRHIAPYVEALQPTVGAEEHSWDIEPSYFYAQGCTLSTTQAIKACVDVPVIAVNKLGEPYIANAAVAEGKADFVCLGRPLYADPQWIEKAAKGESHKIVKCIGCLNCFSEKNRQDIYPVQRTCTVNPATLREEKFNTLIPTEEAQRILVVGAGLAGMEAATTLSLRGHQVTLCEKSDKLGGQWIIAAYADDKNEYKSLIPFKKAALNEAKVLVSLNTSVDKDYMENYKPGFLVLATGAAPKSLSFPYPLGQVNVVQGNDVIMDQALVGERVVIIGGRFVGMEAAVKLAKQGKHVSLVDMEDIGHGTDQRLFGMYRNEMVENGVYLYPNCPVARFSDEGVSIVHSGSLLTLPTDTIVLAVGTKPVHNLVRDLESLKIPYACIGDCKRIGDALSAIRDGAELGRQL